MKNKTKSPDAVFEHTGSMAIGLAQGLDLWHQVPLMCGNCAIAFESRKCKSTSCQLKYLERNGLAPAY